MTMPTLIDADVLDLVAKSGEIYDRVREITGSHSKCDDCNVALQETYTGVNRLPNGRDGCRDCFGDQAADKFNAVLIQNAREPQATSADVDDFEGMLNSLKNP